MLVAVALGAILLITGGTVGFDQDDESVDIGANEGETPTETTEAAPETTAPPATVPPAELQVVAANGAGIAGLAGSTTDFLATQGYTNSIATDATSSAEATTVYFAEGFDANAAAIATLLGLAPETAQPLPVGTPLAGEQPAEAAIVIVLGPDAEAAVNAAPTTTAPG